MQNANEQTNIERKLKIGYILPELRVLKTAFFSYALIELADTDRIDVFCYTQGGAAELQKRCVDKPIAWRDLTENPEKVLQLFVHDKLDYLVDLSEHNTRLVQAILQRRVAPVQLSTLGYFNTTRISNVDYLLSDRICTPESGDCRYFTEKIIYIPQTFMAYKPFTERDSYTEAPLVRNGYVTFGCLHHFSRLTDEFLQIWQKILAALPKAKLVLKSRIFANAYGCEETRYRLKRLGFDISQIEFRSMKAKDVDEYANIDIILDTVPYQGVMTTCDALYMGVPVVAFAGKKHSMRMGCSILQHVGLADCVAYDVNSYIEKAVALAHNKYRLVNLHKNLRENMLASALMDGQRYAHNVENIYYFLQESAEKRQKDTRLLNELTHSLYNSEEKLAFLHGRLVAGDLQKNIMGGFSDVLYTMRNIKFALLRFENVDMTTIDLLVRACTDAHKKAESGNFAKTCEIISGQIMPQIKKLLLLLDEMKVSTIG